MAMQRTFKEAMAQGRHGSKRLLHKWRMVLDHLSNFLLADLLDCVGYPVPNVLQIAPWRGMKLVLLPRDFSSGPG